MVMSAGVVREVVRVVVMEELRDDDVRLDPMVDVG